MIIHPIQLDSNMMMMMVQDSEAYENYVDAIMLIHDILAGYTQDQDRPRFNAEEIAQLMEKTLREAKSTAIDENIRRNYDLALKIKQISDEHEREEKATLFLHELLQIYTTLRTLKHAVAPGIN